MPLISAVLRSLRTLSLALMLGWVGHAAQAQQAGVGAWENPSYTTLDWIEGARGLDWYYNWRTDQIASHSNRSRRVEFVPMIHGADNIGDTIRSSRRVRHLLGFNEPDGHGGSHQAGMSVEEAIALWPRLEATGLRLGSPATTREGTLGRGSWQSRFMAEVERRGLRVDFMAVHYYSTNGSVDEFRNWLVQVYNTYRRPIWVTEFAYIDWSRPSLATYEANAAFAHGAIRMMETLPFVERHAWFAANPYNWDGLVPEINLVDNDMQPTPLGQAFANIISGQASADTASLMVDQ
ncbi:glycoside hydrolase family protein [Maritalea mobilis]|uniref:glycosyl hydrolase n=1 Tax=Maritalea mobilis TaxID=483324 RepID=UPI001C978BAE|nr:glycosyl hydrolase [Maritalea mobilis]MBY6199756.1 glycoside hydrolase family protein [Maritalea mobilis]